MYNICNAILFFYILLLLCSYFFAVWAHKLFLLPLSVLAMSVSSAAFDCVAFCVCQCLQCWIKVLPIASHLFVCCFAFFRRENHETPRLYVKQMPRLTTHFCITIFSCLSFHHSFLRRFSLLLLLPLLLQCLGLLSRCLLRVCLFFSPTVGLTLTRCARSLSFFPFCSCSGYFLAHGLFYRFIFHVCWHTHRRSAVMVFTIFKPWLLFYCSQSFAWFSHFTRIVIFAVIVST